MESSDEQLIFDFGGGNTRAFEELVERFKKRIFNFALRYLGNRADAEDVTSDVFLALYTKAHLFKPKAKFSTWLFCIARNQCLDQIRKKKKTMSTRIYNRDESSAMKEWDVPDKTPLVSEQMQKQETALQVKKAIDHLPAEQKEALILREYHEFSYKEIAEILNCSLEQVKILIFRARENLRQGLAPVLTGDNSHGT